MTGLNQLNLSTASKFVIVITVVVVLFEWMLLELIRRPYSPPHDMSTLLGTEITAVVFLMGLIAFGWVGLMIYCLANSHFNFNDFTFILLLSMILFALIAPLVCFPPWPVANGSIGSR